MLRCVVLVTLLLAGATGCGGDEGAAAPTPSTAPATSATPGGVTSTAPGTSLEFGDAATLVWQPAAGLTGVLDVTVESVAEQRQSVFEGWLRDDSMKQTRPYFVTVTLTNVGDADLADQVVPLYLRDERGRLGAPWTLGGDFTACQSGPLPSPFAPGATREMCLVFLAPDGARIEDMVFEPTEGYDPITWTGEVEAPAKVRTRGRR